MARREYDRGRDVEYVRDYRTESPPPPPQSTAQRRADPYASEPPPRRGEPAYPPDPYRRTDYAHAEVTSPHQYAPPGQYSAISPHHSQASFSAPPPKSPPTPSAYRRPASPLGRYDRGASPPGGYHRGPSPPGTYHRGASPPGGYGRPASPPGGYHRADSPHGHRSPSPAGVPRGVRFVEPTGTTTPHDDPRDTRGRPPSPGYARSAGAHAPPAGMSALERDAWDRVYERELAESRDLPRDRDPRGHSASHDRGFSADIKTSHGTASFSYDKSRDDRRQRHKDERESGLAWSDSDSDSERERPPRAPRRYEPSPRRHDSVSVNDYRRGDAPLSSDPRRGEAPISSDPRRGEAPLSSDPRRGEASILSDPRRSEAAPAPPPPSTSTALALAPYEHRDDASRRPSEPIVREPIIRHVYDEPRRYVQEHVTVQHINRPPSPERRAPPTHYDDDPYYGGGGHRRETSVSASYHHGHDDPYYDNPRSSASALRHASVAGVSTQIERLDFHDRRGSAPPVSMPYPPSPPSGYHSAHPSRYDHSPIPSPEFKPRDTHASFHHEVSGSISLGAPAAPNPPGGWPGETIAAETKKVDHSKQHTEPYYDPHAHATSVYKALKGRSADSVTLIKILPFLSGYEMTLLRSEYKKVHPDGMSLSKHIKTSLTGRFQLAAYVAASGPWDGECYWAKLSGQKPQFRYDLLVEALMGRTNDEILDIKDAYTDKKNNHDIVAALEKELSADKNTGARFTEMIMLQLSAKRMEEWDTVYLEKVREDVEFLNKTMSKDKADVSFLIEFVVLRNDTHLREAMKLYKKTYTKDLARTIFGKVPTMVGDALLHILNGVLNRPARDARLLEESMKGVGTRDELLVARLTRIHWDPEHMQAVKEVYKEKYKMTLKDRVIGDTSGDYQTFLVAMTTAGTNAVVVKK